MIGSEAKTIFNNQLLRTRAECKSLLAESQKQLDSTYRVLAQKLGSRSDLLVHLDTLQKESVQYAAFPSLHFLLDSLKQAKSVFIGSSCIGSKTIKYSISLLCALAAEGDSRGVTLVSSRDVVLEAKKYQAAGLTAVSFEDYSKIGSDTVVIVHCANRYLVDVACNIMGELKPHIIIGSEEVYNVLRTSYPIIKTFRLCKSRSSSFGVDCYDRQNQLDDRLKMHLEDGFSDLLVLCEPEKMKQVASIVHQQRRHCINCLEVAHGIDQFTYLPKRTNVFIADSTATFRKVAPSAAEVEVRVVIDYNSQRTITYEADRDVYLQENAQPITSEQLSERLALAEELQVDNYIIFNKTGVRCLRRSFNCNDVSAAILRYGKSKVENAVTIISVPELKQAFDQAITFLTNRENLPVDDQLRLKISAHAWNGLSPELFANELLCLGNTPTILESPSVLHYFYLLFAYMRNTVSRPIEKKHRLSEFKGDIHLLQLLVAQYGSFDKFLNQELTRNKRKVSEGSVDLDHPVVMRQQSSFQGEGKVSAGNIGKGLKFNILFILKWREQFEKIYGDCSVVLQEKQKIVGLWSAKPVSFSRPLKKYILSNVTKDGYYVAKHSVLASIFPQPKHLTVQKVVKSGNSNRSDDILCAQQCQPEELIKDDEILEFNQITTSILSPGTVKDFEEKHNCEIELNPQFQSIIVCCKKEVRAVVEEEFRALLQQLLGTVKNQQIARSYGVKTLLFGAGGRIANVTAPTEVTANSLVAIRNLPGEWTQADVLQLLQEEGAIQSVVMHRNREDEQLRDAIVEFIKADDAIAVYKLYDGVEVCGNILRVCKPCDIKNPYMKEHKQIILRWYTHKCDRTGQVLFENEESCRKAMEGIREYVNEQLTVPSEGLLVLRNLEEWVDEQYIRQLYGQQGRIQKISLKKIALPEKDNSQLLYYHLGEALGTGIRFTVSQIRTVDRQIGQKEVTVSLENIESADKVYGYFNNKLNILGKARTYGYRDLQCTYLGNESLIRLLKRLIEQFLRDKGIQQSDLQLKLANFDDEYYLTVQSNNTALFRMVSSKIDEARRGQVIPPDSEGLALTDLGRKRLSEIKQKFTCQITVLNLSKSLSIICNESDLPAICKEVEELPLYQTQLEYRLTRKMFDAMVSNNKYLEELSKFASTELILENLSLELKGELKQLTIAKQYIADLSKEINKQLVSE